MFYIDADPYKWPFDGNLSKGNTALIVIDMQTDFCGPNGYVAAMGYDIRYNLRHFSGWLLFRVKMLRIVL